MRHKVEMISRSREKGILLIGGKLGICQEDCFRRNAESLGHGRNWRFNIVNASPDLPTIEGYKYPVPPPLTHNSLTPPAKTSSLPRTSCQSEDASDAADVRCVADGERHAGELGEVVR